MRIVVLLGLIACGAPGSVEPNVPVPRMPPVPLQPQRFELPNGMKVILVPDANADLASVVVRYRVGSIDEPAGQAGVAHLAAHVSYAPPTGTLTLWDKLDRIGTWIDTKPDSEHTDFSVQCEPAQLAEVLKLEAERLARRCDGVTEYWFNWLRGEVREEMRASANRLTANTVAQALYPAASPYRGVYAASPDSVDALSRDQTCRFLDEHYAPSNVVVVVSGPIEPAAFEQMIRRDLGTVPARTTKPPAPRGMLARTGFRQRLSADVAEPTLVVAWPLPGEVGERSIMLFASDLLATTLKSPLVIEDNHVMLWLTKNDAGIDATLARVRATLSAGLIAPPDFEKTRVRRITTMLAKLDSIPSRLAEVANDADLDAPFAALDRVNVQGFDRLVAQVFDWSHARVIELQPDGSRPRWRPASLQDPPHHFRGPSSFPDAGEGAPVVANSNALSRARTFQLANGMTVVLAPTSPVPLVDIRLAFRVGTAAEPPDHHGTAMVAIAVLEQIASRGTNSEKSSWAVGGLCSGAAFDSSGICVRGPTMYVDLLMNQFAGLAESQFQQIDVLKGHDWLVRTAESPIHRLWDESAQVRSAVYGANHPYAQAKAPTIADVKNFDAREVETFYRRYLQPNNATLIVTGGFDLDDVTKLVHRAFDGWHGKGESVSTATPHGKPASYAAVDRSSTVTLHVEWPTGSVDAHYEARGILGTVIHATSSRIAASNRSYRSGGTFVIDGKFDPATAAVEIRQFVQGLERVRAGDERYKSAFVTARRRAARALVGGARSAGQWASWIRLAVENGRDVTWLATMPRRTAGVTFEEIVRLANTELLADRATWFVSGPRDAVAEVYAVLGVEPTWQ